MKTHSLYGNSRALIILLLLPQILRVMAVCSVLFKAYTPRLLLSVFFCSTIVVFALACYMLLLSSASMASLAAFLPQIPAASIIYSHCQQTSRAGFDRGSQLFHSWSDAELFDRTLTAEARISSEGSTEGNNNRGITGLSLGLRNSLFAMPEARTQYLQQQESSVKSSDGEENQGRSSFAKSEQDQPWCFHLHHRQMHRRFKPKVAFLFLTRGPLPFAPLWNAFFHSHENLYNIYIHLDPFRVGAFDQRSAGVFWGRMIPSDITARGTPSLVAAERRLLANALLDDPLNHYFALVSERCIPLVSFRKLYDRLVASDKSFLEILKDEPTLNDRYKARGPASVMLPDVPFESFRVGSQFFVLTREHAVMVIKDERIWSKFRLPCIDESNCYAEEHYFPTFIDMADAGCATRFTLTNVDWSRSSGDGHPRSYGKAEVGRELITALRRNGTYLFARKFEDECLEPLLQLSSFILGEEDASGTPIPE